MGLPGFLRLQGRVYLVVIAGLALWLAGKSAPARWLLLDAAFGACNLWSLLQPGTRKAFARQQHSRWLPGSFQPKGNH